MADLPPGGGQDAWKWIYCLHALMMEEAVPVIFNYLRRQKASVNKSRHRSLSIKSQPPRFFFLLFSLHPGGTCFSTRRIYSFISTSPPCDYAIAAIVPPRLLSPFSSSRDHGGAQMTAAVCQSHPVILLIRRRSY